MVPRYRGSNGSDRPRDPRAPAGPCRVRRLPSRVPGGGDDYGVAVVELLDEDVDALTLADLHRLADDVGLDRQLASPAVDQHREADAPGSAEIRQLVERCTDGAARVEHVIDDDDVLVVDRPWKVGWPDDGSRPDGLEVVTVERDVERAAGDVDVLAIVDVADEAGGELDP